MAISMEVNPKQLRLLIVLLAIAAIGGLYKYVFEPQSVQHAAAKAELERVETQQRVGLIRLQRADKIEADMYQALEILREHEALIPDEADIHYLYRDMEQAARKHSVTLYEISVAAPKVRGRFLEIGIGYRIEGRYSDVLGYFETLESLPRVINVLGFALDGLNPSGSEDTRDSGDRISASVDMNTFVRPKGGVKGGS